MRQHCRQLRTGCPGVIGSSLAGRGGGAPEVKFAGSLWKQQGGRVGAAVAFEEDPPGLPTVQGHIAESAYWSRVPTKSTKEFEAQSSREQLRSSRDRTRKCAVSACVLKTVKPPSLAGCQRLT